MYQGLPEEQIAIIFDIEQNRAEVSHLGSIFYTVSNKRILIISGKVDSSTMET